MPGADFSFSAHTIDMAHCSSFADRLYYGYPCAAAAGNDTTAHPSTRLATYAANATSAGTNAGHRTAGTPRTPSWRWTQESHLTLDLGLGGWASTARCSSTRACSAAPS